MPKKQTVFSVLEYEEIIGRFISITSRFEGPSCFPVRITFDACNTVQPPCISAEVMNIRCDGSTETIFHSCVDQDTTFNAFLDDLHLLTDVTEKILRSCEDNIPYEELQEKKESDNDGDDLPF